MYARVINSATCFECSAPAECEHHVVPRSRGGTMTVPLCGRCHGRAHHTNRNMASGALVRESHARRRAMGMRPSGGRPYGYEWSGKRNCKTLLPVPRELRALELARLMSTEGYCGKTVADALNRWGVRPLRAKAWSAELITHLISREPIPGTDDRPLAKGLKDMAIRELSSGNWQATLYAAGRHHHLGTFSARTDAQEHYDHCLALSKTGVLDFPTSPKARIYDPHASRHAALVSEIVSQYESGKTIAEVSRSTGVPLMSAYHLLKKAGVKCRPRGKRSQPPTAAPAA